MKTLKFILSATLYMFFSLNLFAQAPSTFSYQAVVRNSSNNLVINSTVGVKFSILQGSTTGTVAYAETQIPTTNSNGLFSTQIGGGTIVSGNFSSIDWSLGNFFLNRKSIQTEGQTTV